MAIMCERLRDDGLYDMAWALGILRTPVGFVEPRESVNWDRFKNDLRLAFGYVTGQAAATIRTPCLEPFPSPLSARSGGRGQRLPGQHL